MGKLIQFPVGDEIVKLEAQSLQDQLVEIQRNLKRNLNRLSELYEKLHKVLKELDEAISED